MELKPCNRCSVTKKLEYFPKAKTLKSGRTGICKKCTAERIRIYVNKPETKQKIREYNYSTKDKRKAYYRKRNKDPKRKACVKVYNRRAKLKKAYNITLEDFDNLLKLQKNSCAICLNIFTKGTKFIHVDHCHITNKIRGLLCSHCNVGIGNFFDNVTVMRNAINYIYKFKVRR